MTVKLVDVSSVEAKRFTKVGEEFRGNIRIDHNSTITTINVKDEDLLIEFRFTANYQSLGIIKMEGTIVYHTKNNISDVIEMFNTTRNIPPEDATEVHNAVLRACIPLATYLARDIKLPPPVPIPNVSIPKKGEKKGGKHGDSPEVA